MTATPHSGKEDDFQLFMALLDGDRFEGRFREGVHTADVTDMMRRLTKEELRPSTAGRCSRSAAPTPSTTSSRPTRPTLYDGGHRLRPRGDEPRRPARPRAISGAQNVGFALQILQRRLASSPAAIHQSLRRRRERLQRRVEEARLLQRGRDARLDAARELTAYRPEFFEDLDDRPEAEVEAVEERLVDSATAAQTIAELEIEIAALAQPRSSRPRRCAAPAPTPSGASCRASSTSR